MGMSKVAGTELATGCVTVTGAIVQSTTTSAGGELREYRDEDGNVISLYLYDDHKQASFEGLLPASSALALQSKGATLTIDDLTIYVTECQIQCTNNDVSKISVTGRTYPDLSSGSGGNT